MLNKNLKDREVADYLKAKDQLLDVLGIFTDHNTISGDITEYVQMDDRLRLNRAMDLSQKLYKQTVKQ